ncbi:MAG: CoA transferase, partial [Deltaproteobacteria bacterium]|nr:CoA transferase [Deltaproteobacteria bacterium]
NAGSNYLVGGKIPGRWGNAHPTIVPYQSFQTANSFLVLGAASESIWKRLCPALGRPDLTDDPRFAKNANRVENRKELIAIISAIFLTRNTEDWITALTKADVPCAPVQTIDQVFAAPQVRHRKMLEEVDHPTAGKIKLAGIPVKFSGTPASVRLAPPLLGQHNNEVLSSWLGMSENEINKLKTKQVL